MLRCRSLFGARRLILGLCAGTAILLAGGIAVTETPGDRQTATVEEWTETLAYSFAEIDRRAPGTLGVFVADLKGERSVSYRADRQWYLASTVKVPLAIAVLQDVDSGKRSLSDTITLEKSDYVDGAGDLIWEPPGAELSLGEAIQGAIRDSDSTASDLLIREMGAATVNARLERMPGGKGFGDITSILQVRYDAFEELHPAADALSNIDIIEINTAGDYQARRRALAAKLGISERNLALGSWSQAFERYYARGLNSASLEAFGELLAALARGELLSEESTDFLLDAMSGITTGNSRIAAGLPNGTWFAQKTGTQIGRVCNVGIIKAGSRVDGLIVAACAEGMTDIRDGEAMLRDVGATLGRTLSLE